MGNRTPRAPLPQQRRDEDDVDDDLVDDDPDDDDEDDDDDDMDDENDVDPLLMLQILRERMEPAVGRPWVEIAATCESITYAMEIKHGPASIGCLIRVVSWDLQGWVTSSDPVWLGATTLADLTRDP